MADPRTFVVVGAGLCGATTVATLRAEGFDGRIVLIGAALGVLPQRRMGRAGLAALGLLAALAPSFAGAQGTFPTRTVKFIVPFPGGGINDVLARIVGEKLQTRWGQPIVIENKTGAGGNIGAELAYQSEGDGYTLLLSPPGPLAVNQSLYKQLSYKPQEFVPITVVGSVPQSPESITASTACSSCSAISQPWVMGSSWPGSSKVLETSGSPSSASSAWDTTCRGIRTPTVFFLGCCRIRGASLVAGRMKV